MIMELTSLFDLFKTVILLIKNTIDGLNITFMGHDVTFVAIVTIVLVSCVLSLLIYGDDDE